MAAERDDRFVDLLEQQQAEFANELHDTLLPWLFAARLQVEQLQAALGDAAFDPQFIAILDTLTQADGAGRRLMNHYDSPDFQTVTWHATLQHYISRGLGTHNAEIHLELAADTADLPSNVALAFYRIAQEAVRNALRHGKASLVTVHCRCRDGIYQLSINDNGCGFDVDQVPAGHYGLRNIRRRAAAVAASLIIDSHPGSGTNVQVILKPAPALSAHA